MAIITTPSSAFRLNINSALSSVLLAQRSIRYLYLGHFNHLNGPLISNNVDAVCLLFWYRNWQLLKQLLDDSNTNFYLYDVDHQPLLRMFGVISSDLKELV